MSSSTIAPTPPASTDRSPSVGPVTRRAALRGIGGGGLTAALALAVVPRLASAAPAHTQPDPATAVDPAAFLGAWDLSFKRLKTDSDSGPAPDRSLAVFAPDGGFQAAMAPIWVSPDGRTRFHGNGLGGWTAWDTETVVVRYTVMVYDEIGVCEGIRLVTITFNPDLANATLSGAYESRHYDLGGELGDIASGTVVGLPARARLFSTPETETDGPGPLVPVGSVSTDPPPLPGYPGEPY